MFEILSFPFRLNVNCQSACQSPTRTRDWFTPSPTGVLCPQPFGHQVRWYHFPSLLAKTADKTTINPVFGFEMNDFHLPRYLVHGDPLERKGSTSHDCSYEPVIDLVVRLHIGQAEGRVSQTG